MNIEGQIIVSKVGVGDTYHISIYPGADFVKSCSALAEGNTGLKVAYSAVQEEPPTPEPAAEATPKRGIFKRRK